MKKKKKNEKSFESKNDREVNEFDGIEKSLEEEEKKKKNHLNLKMRRKRIKKLKEII